MSLGVPSVPLWLSLQVNELFNDVAVFDFNSLCVEALGATV